MFPIYSFGLTYDFDFVKEIIALDYLRYLSYPFWIWGIELLIGYPISKFGIIDIYQIINIGKELLILFISQSGYSLEY